MSTNEAKDAIEQFNDQADKAYSDFLADMSSALDMTDPPYGVRTYTISTGGPTCYVEVEFALETRNVWCGTFYYSHGNDRWERELDAEELDAFTELIQNDLPCVGAL